MNRMETMKSIKAIGTGMEGKEMMNGRQVPGCLSLANRRDMSAERKSF